MNEFNEGGINPEDLGININPESATPDKAEPKELKEPNEAQQTKIETYGKATLSAKTVDEKGIILPSMKSMKNGLEMKGTGFGG